MTEHINLLPGELRKMIKLGKIQSAGNKSLKIYGTLQCRSGKRMKPGNRVFFADYEEATRLGFRPCCRCLPDAYKNWKEYGTV